MIPHLQIEKELASGELINLTPCLLQRRMLYWHRFAPESRMMRKVTDALLEYGHKVLRQIKFSPGVKPGELFYWALLVVGFCSAAGSSWNTTST